MPEVYQNEIPFVKPPPIELEQSAKNKKKAEGDKQ